MRLVATLLLAALPLALSGCSPENYDNVGGATLTEIDAIRNDTSLRPFEQRDALAALGFSPSTINALLRSVTLANQFGGNLRTAFDKITAGRFTALTPDEIQIWAASASNVDTTLSYSFTDAQAQATAGFFADENLDTKAQLSAFLDDSANVVPSTIPDNSLQDLFVDFDPNLVIPNFP
jgi:hypothetical protein